MAEDNQSYAFEVRAADDGLVSSGRRSRAGVKGSGADDGIMI